MKGIWAWPTEPNDQDVTLQKIIHEDELGTIIAALTKSPDGLSNAQIDKLLANNSQWRTLLHMRELIAVGFVQYQIQFFGEAGKYTLTDLGKSTASKMQPSIQTA